MAEEWIPRTRLGEHVKNGDITDITTVLRSEDPIREYQIVDWLIPNIDDEIILTGGTPGKGGGARRTISKRTVRMHKSGRRFSSKVLVVVGNEDGLLGLGESSATETRDAIEQSIEEGKRDIVEIVRGCGSWECGCHDPHSIPVHATGKSGSVTVELIPAPKGIGLAVSDEVKKLMRLAGIEDIWMKSRGKTRNSENMIKATFDALTKMNGVNMPSDVKEANGVVRGVC